MRNAEFSARPRIVSSLIGSHLVFATCMRCVQKHRTPVDAMASVSSLVTILRSAFSYAVDPVTVCREAIDYWSETMDKCLNERDRLASKRICDVEYDEISRDPIAAVRRIYDHFGWSL